MTRARFARITLILGLLAAVGAALIRPIDIRRDQLPSLPVYAVVALSSGVDSPTELDAAGRLRLGHALTVAASIAPGRLVTTRVIDRGNASDSAQALIVKSAGYGGKWDVLGLDEQTTRGEVLALRRSAPPGSAIVVVTSPSHSARACAAFEHAGFRVYCLPVAGGPDFESSAYERLARAKYRIMGWIP